MRRNVIIALVLLIALTAGYLVYSSGRAQSWLADRQQRNLPPAENRNGNATTNATGNRNVANTNAITNAVSTPLPAEKNLAVPFTSQAPHANWDTDHGEFCEEASALMVGRYFQNRGFSGPDDAERALQEIKQWQLDNLGYYYDTTAAETARFVEDLYDLNVEIVERPTINDIKRAIAGGKLVMVPAAGRKLGNPNYTAPGPIYHMIVVRGYTKDGKFITNDPGTRRGEQYVYDQDVLMEAISDWVPAEDRTLPRNGDVAGGRKVILVVSESA